MPAYSTLRTSQTQPRMQTPDIRVALSHFLRQIEAAHVRTRTQRPKPLHFNSMTGELSEFSWPGEPNPDSKTAYDELKRVPPSSLESHRRTHRFRGPCCLCAFIDGKEYTEAQIAVVEVLTKDEDRNRCLLNGEYVAQCAEQRCGYLLCLERFYTLNDLSVHMYPLRAHPLPVQDLAHISDIEKSFRRGDGLFQVMPDIVLRGNRRGLEQVDLNGNQAVDSRLWDRLMAGMPEDDFWTTFVQCIKCNKVAFRKRYAVNHRCSRIRSSESTRLHPYRRLSRASTVLIGDEPEALPVRSMANQHRASSPGSTYNYDPEDVVFPDEGTWDQSSVRESDSEAAEDEISDEARELASDDQTQLWWMHDAPELPSDDESLPDILTVVQGGTERPQTSSVRTRMGSEVAEIPNVDH